MQTIAFTTEEMAVLREVLDCRLNEIGMEVVRTDRHDFKQMLKHRQEVLEQVLAKLPEAPVAA